MTRRAEVFRARVDGVPCWHIDVEGIDHHKPICTEREDWHEALSLALAETGQLRDGTPYQPCGLGPCAMGHGHTGACRC